MDVIQTGELDLTTSYLSDWTDVIVDVPNAPASASLNISMVVDFEGGFQGPKLFVVLYHPAIQIGDAALMVGLRSEPDDRSLEASTTAFAASVSFGGVTDGVPQWSWWPHGYAEAPESYRESILSADYPDDGSTSISFLIAGGAIQATVNGLVGSMSVPPSASTPSGDINAHINSSLYTNDEKRSNFYDLDRFAIGSGASTSRFWTNFVSSYEAP